jgi:activator of 2-hydroxyglutaryl-CoA dehydratase
VYKADGTTPAPHVEIGVRDGTKLFKVCSAANGNFWQTKTDTLAWANAEIRARNANGEAKMVSKSTTGGCNSCHGATLRIKEP